MPGSIDPGHPGFPATRHSLIEALGAADPDARRPAYDALFAVYWKPVHGYLRVVRGFGHEDAEDLTQEFFARAFERETLATFDPSRARFRTFLRVCLDRFAANHLKAAGRLKRGGGLAPVPIDLPEAEAAAAGPDPEQFFRREWIRALFEGALADLTTEYRTRGKETQLAVFLATDVEPPSDGERPSYAELAARHGVPVTQITNYLAAARRLFRRAALARLRSVSSSEEEYLSEARELFGIEPE